jgi:hypothetical protein
MPLEFTVDLAGETVESIESGTQTPPGWYSAKLEDVFEDERNPGVVVFKYKVLGGNGGVWTGRCIFDRVGDPDAAEGEAAATFVRRRVLLLARRLGLLDDDRIAAGGQPALSWYDAIGKEVVLDVRRRSYDEKDRATGQKTGNRRETVSVDFAGVYPVGGHSLDKLPKDCPTDARQLIGGGRPAPGTPAARSAPAAPRTQAHVPDFSDL